MPESVTGSRKEGDDKMMAREFSRKFGIDLPKIIYEMLERNDGREMESNCWNTARKIVGSKIPYRWEKDRRMCTWLGRYCIRITSNDAQRGDILTFWYPDGRIGYASSLTHAAYYLDHGWFFQKDGDLPFEFVTLDDIQQDDNSYARDRRVWYRYVGLDKNRKL